MISDLDILRAGQLLVKRHGADAPVVAARRADELLDTSSFDFLNLFLFMLQFMGQRRD